MLYYQRALAHKLSMHQRQKIILLFGARQSGKTTLLRSLSRDLDCLTLNLQDRQLRRRYETDAGNLRRSIYIARNTPGEYRPRYGRFRALFAPGRQRGRADGKLRQSECNHRDTRRASAGRNKVDRPAPTGPDRPTPATSRPLSGCTKTAATGVMSCAERRSDSSFRRASRRCPGTCFSAVLSRY